MIRHPLRDDLALRVVGNPLSQLIDPDPGSPVALRITVISVAVPTALRSGRYGDQLRPFGILGVPGDGTPHVTYEEQPGTYGDGTAFSLQKPSYSIDGWNYGEPSRELIGRCDQHRTAGERIGILNTRAHKGFGQRDLMQPIGEMTAL